jgi:DNA-binding MarR family transcriptional regulator
MMWEIGRAYYAYVGVAERILAHAGLAEHIRPGMGLVLFALYEQDGRTIKEIAARSQLACSTLSGLLARMEKAGLIQRSRDDQDARLVRVRLTALARSLETKCRAMVKQMSGIIEVGLGERKVAQAQQLLRCLIETLRSEDERMARSQAKK